MSEPAEFKQLPAVAEDLDFVCNAYALAEKQPQEPGIKFKRNISRLGVDMLIVSLFLLAGWGSFVLIDAIFHPFPLGTFSKVLVFALLASFFFNFYSRVQSFPTNVRLTPKGLRFAWRQTQTVQSPIIAWESIVLVSAKGGNSSDWTSGAVIKIVFDRAHFDSSKLFNLFAQTYSLWTSAFPFHTAKFGMDINLVSLEFPLDALTLEADRFRLITALQAHCPEGTLSGEFKELLEPHETPTFTQFWLDDMQSFRRRHIDDLQVGQTLQDGRYEILGKIGTGGHAKIYQAEDHAKSNFVAIKELVLPVSAGAGVRNRAFCNVKNEALLLCSLDHPGIVKLLDNFVEDHRAYLVLEHVQGKTLRRHVQDNGAFSVDQTLQFAGEICEFLIYLHGLSPPIVHRDLTPDNLMLSSDGRIKLLDFNVAQQLESNTTRTVVGKHNYMAPEQFRGKPTTQSDLYSLGCTLYYLIVGADPTPLTCLKTSDKVAVPADLDELISQLTKLEPADRCPSAADAQQQVTALMKNASSTATKISES